jgi:ribosomal protein S8
MDPIANMLTIIRNGYQSGKDQIDIPRSKIKESIAKTLVDLKFLDSVNK